MSDFSLPFSTIEVPVDLLPEPGLPGKKKIKNKRHIFMVLRKMRKNGKEAAKLLVETHADVRHLQECAELQKMLTELLEVNSGDTKNEMMATLAQRVGTLSQKVKGRAARREYRASNTL